MSTRQSNNSTSSSGVSYPAGNAAATGAASTVVGIKISLDTAKTTTSKLGKSGAFNGNTVEVWADGAVLDTGSGTYLFPGRDFNPGDLQRS